MNMRGFLTPVFVTHQVRCINYKGLGDYNDDGDYVEGDNEEFTAPARVRVASVTEAQDLVQMGEATLAQRFYSVHINTGQQVYQEREESEGVMIAASEVHVTLDGKDRTLRILYADNRPDAFYCKALGVLEKIK